MSTTRDFEQFVAGFQAGRAGDYSALMRQFPVTGRGNIWLRDPAPGPTQADRDHFHKLLAAAMVGAPPDEAELYGRPSHFDMPAADDSSAERLRAAQDAEARFYRSFFRHIF